MEAQPLIGFHTARTTARTPPTRHRPRQRQGARDQERSCLVSGHLCGDIRRAGLQPTERSRLAVCGSEGRGLFDLGEQFHRRDETVPAAWKRLNVAGLVRIVSERGTELLNAVIHTLLEVHKNVRAPEFSVYLLPRDELARAETSSFRSFSDWGLSLTGRCALRNSRVAASKSKIPNRNCRLSVKPPPYLLRGPQQDRSLSSAPASESRSPRSARPFLARVCTLTRDVMEKPPGDHCHVATVQ